METQKEKRIMLPARRQFLVLVPFCLCYAAFIVLGNWQKSAAYSNLQNIGRIILWALISYAVLLVLCLVISRRDTLLAGVPLAQKLPAQKKRPGNGMFFRDSFWFVYSVICLII